MRAYLGLTVLALSAGAVATPGLGDAQAGAAQAPPTRAQAAAAPARPAPPYVVVQGVHTASADAGQQLTVMCPANHHALGAGFSALMQAPPKTQGGPPATAEGGLDGVRSVPNTQGTGWQVSGFSPDAARAKQPWALVVRVVCLQTPG